VENAKQFAELSDNHFIQIGLANCDSCMPVKNIKPFIDELVNRGYNVLFNKVEDLLYVSFEMPKE